MSKVNEILEGLHFIDEEDYSDGIFEMANLEKDESGLPYNIWLDSVGKYREVSHNLPRIKVDIYNNCKILVPVSIDKSNPENLSRNPHIKINKFGKVSKWIIKNYDILIKHWNHEIKDSQALNMLNKDYKEDK